MSLYEERRIAQALDTPGTRGMERRRVHPRNRRASVGVPETAFRPLTSVGTQSSHATFTTA